MAGSARYTAILDANVLYPQLIRDVLLSLATAGLYHARWTDEINNEWVRNLAIKRPDIAEKISPIIEAMNRSVPDCLVTGYENLIGGLELPDTSDRHVLAAAIVGHADAIVTFNLKHFPNDALAIYGIEAQHPDDFVMNQLQLHEIKALTAIKEMRERWKNPPYAAASMLQLLEGRGLPQTAEHLQNALKLI